MAEPRTLRQFAHLTLRWREGGHAAVDDAKGNPEDRANVVALAVVLARRQYRVIAAREEHERDVDRLYRAQPTRRVTDQSLEELLEWAVQKGINQADQIAKRIKNGLALSPKDAENLRLELVERRFQIEHPDLARLLRAGIDITQPPEYDDPEDEGDDGDTWVDYSDVRLATLGGPTMPWDVYE